MGIGAAVLLLLAVGAFMVFRADAKTNKVALTDEPRPVSVIEARGTTYRASRTYVGTLEPWVAANVGPQLVSAYVDTVLVRPGAIVRKGDVIATLDCKTASATSQAVAMQARALEARQKAVANESARVQGLLDGGFVSPNEAEQKAAQSASEQAQLLATQAKVLGTSLEVNDCILRAPFAGEVGTRTADPGAFVRPGVSIVSIVDRSTIRVTGDAPEVDFGVITPGTKVTVHVISTDKDLVATIARRAPTADPTTRTVHFELDVPDPERTIPVGTTAEIRIEVGTPAPATLIPLAAASVRGSKVSVFVIEGDVAHLRVVPLKGEIGGKLYLDPQLPPGARIVTEGRALLSEGDRVAATLEPSTTTTTTTTTTTAAGAP
ncbi:MAG: rane fusion protein multidrug efflux system [Myxococcales bacterium]|jgi:RND family efflux transporter MFP subunit|nr:rane fusion protein multidrug efflux system [Myxococcales bacterium]